MIRRTLVLTLVLVALVATSLSTEPNQTNDYLATINEIDEDFIPSSVESRRYIVRYDARWPEVKRIWGRGTDAVVRDIVTGRTFELRRTFGTNHADVEPLTKEDADIMYDIWGGWCWSRRAVVVYVGDYVFAGSLTNFPHAGLDRYPALERINNRSGGFGRGLNFDAVKGNGVDGHMCLHFAGSGLHSNGRSDARHQREVQKAIGYIQSSSRYVERGERR